MQNLGAAASSRGRSSATLFFVELPGAGAATGAERRLRRADGAAEAAFRNCRVPVSHNDSASLNAEGPLVKSGQSSSASAGPERGAEGASPPSASAAAAEAPSVPAGPRRHRRHRMRKDRRRWEDPTQHPTPSTSLPPAAKESSSLSTQHPIADNNRPCAIRHEAPGIVSCGARGIAFPP